MRTVKHNRREARLDAFLSAFVAAMVKVESNGNGDVKLLEHTVYHSYNGLIAAHILARALGNAENNRRLKLLGGLKYSLCPFKIVDVKLTDGVFTRLCFVKHILCRY